MSLRNQELSFIFCHLASVLHGSKMDANGNLDSFYSHAGALKSKPLPLVCSIGLLFWSYWTSLHNVSNPSSEKCHKARSHEDLLSGAWHYAQLSLMHMALCSRGTYLKKIPGFYNEKKESEMDIDHSTNLPGTLISCMTWKALMKLSKQHKCRYSNFIS